MMARKYPYSSASRFGLVCGQMRDRQRILVKNAGWYDEKGKKVGWGDISAADMRRIAASLRQGELFIVLYERSSWWKFVSFVRRGGKTHLRVSSRERSPGKDYLAAVACFVIAPRRRMVVEDPWRGRRHRRRIDRLSFFVIDEEEAGRRIAGP